MTPEPYSPEDLANSLEENVLDYIDAELNEYDPTHPDHNETMKAVIESIRERVHDHIIELRDVEQEDSGLKSGAEGEER